MNDRNDAASPESSPDEEESHFVRGVYVYTGPQTIADSKMRLAEWLKRREW